MQRKAQLVGQRQTRSSYIAHASAAQSMHASTARACMRSWHVCEWAFPARRKHCLQELNSIFARSWAQWCASGWAQVQETANM